MSSASRILPGSDDVYNAKTGQPGTSCASGPNYAPNMRLSRLGRLRAWRASTATRRSRKRRGARRRISAARTSRCGRAAYPSGFQPYRNSHFNIHEWVGGRLRRGLHLAPISSRSAIPTTTRIAAIEPRIPGIFQYYCVAEDELAEDLRRPVDAHRQGADNIAAAWEKITDQIGRDNQIKLYKASLGS